MSAWMYAALNPNISSDQLVEIMRAETEAKVAAIEKITVQMVERLATMDQREKCAYISDMLPRIVQFAIC